MDSTGCKIYGEGEWKVRQHGYGYRRTWRKLHLGVDEPIDLTNSSGRMIATIQSAIAQAEREAIVQRCRAGVNRVAREGH